VEVRDYPGTPTVDDLTGIVLHSDMDITGSFECSDAMINKLQSNIVWSQKGNFLDIPTDCPQRDERLGWTGDAQVFIRTAAFNMNVANFFTKWLADMADSQGADGRIPSVVPSVESIYGEGGPAWADAAVICPWTLYLCYGDKSVLEQCYPMMQRFLQFLQERSIDFIRADEHWKWKGYGDWLSINAQTPPDFIGTAFYAHCSELMSKIAGILNRPEDAGNYQQLFENVRQAWQKRFVGEDGQIKIQTQTAYVLALHFDLLPEALRGGAVDALVKNIESRGMHLSTGFVGTPYLNHVLTRFGRSGVAYALLHQTTFPSWLYPITQGATTMWERWDSWTHEKGFSDTGMNSFNHYAYGAVGEWIYSTVGGIDLDPGKPGYKHIIIRPRPEHNLTHARASLESLYGQIESEWRIENGRMRLNILIPANTTATVQFATGQPDAITEGGKPAATTPGVRARQTDQTSATYELESGRYVFEVVSPIIT
jgi:alpha-L-rhamnosidase